MMVSSAGEADSEKSARRTVSVTEAVWEPLMPFTVKLYGLGVAALRLLMVRVLFWPAKIVAGLKEQVAPEEQDKVILPVKLPAVDAETVKVADVVPMGTVVVELVEESEKTARPVPDRVTV